MAHKRPKNGKTLNSRRVVFSFHKQALVCLQQALTGLIVCFPRDDLGQWETGNTHGHAPNGGEGEKRERTSPATTTYTQPVWGLGHPQAATAIYTPSIWDTGMWLSVDCLCLLHAGLRQTASSNGYCPVFTRQFLWNCLRGSNSFSQNPKIIYTTLCIPTLLPHSLSPSCMECNSTLSAFTLLLFQFTDISSNLEENKLRGKELSLGSFDISHWSEHALWLKREKAI